MARLWPVLVRTKVTVRVRVRVRAKVSVRVRVRIRAKVTVRVRVRGWVGSKPVP